MHPLRKLLITAVALCLAAPLACAESAAPLTQEVFRQFSDRVVQIRIVDRDADSKSGLGSGFFAAPDLVVTNFHVVADLVHHPKRYRAELIRENGDRQPLTLLNVDVIHDLAVARTNTPNASVFRFASKPPAKGTRLYSLGNPHDLGFSIVEGTFNGLLEESLYEKMHFTGAINPGMSGGPTITHNGEVVGINVSTAGNEVGFLVPAQAAQALIEQSSAAGFQPPASFLSRVRDQLLQNQETYMQQLLAQPFEELTLGEYRLPGRLAKFFKCWGDTDPRRSDQPYEIVHHQCALEDNIYLGRTQRSGTMVVQHALITSAVLNRFQFAALYENQFRGSPYEMTFRNPDMTPYRCHSSFVEQSSRPWKVVVCLRGYKKLDGLYDLMLKAASLNHNDTGVQTSVNFAGVTFDNAMRFTRRYIEALK